MPTKVDYIGFDRYGVADASVDRDFQADLALVKAKRSRADQRIVLIPEGQYWPEYGELGFPPEAMGGVAAGYYVAADNDPAVIGMISYLWPGGLDGPTHLGTRDLPQEAIDVHRQIGRLITGK